MQHMTLAEALERHATSPVDVEGAIAAALGRCDITARKRDLVRGLRAMVVDLERMRRAAEECLAMMAAGAARTTARKLGRMCARHAIIGTLVQEQIDAVMRRDREGWESVDEIDRRERALYTAIRDTTVDLLAPIAAYLDGRRS
jgi:hypothetical protein